MGLQFRSIVHFLVVMLTSAYAFLEETGNPTRILHLGVSTPHPGPFSLLLADAIKKNFTLKI